MTPWAASTVLCWNSANLCRFGMQDGLTSKEVAQKGHKGWHVRPGLFGSTRTVLPVEGVTCTPTGPAQMTIFC